MDKINNVIPVQSKKHILLLSEVFMLFETEYQIHWKFVYE